MKVSCTWGDGPDIVLDLSGSTLILFEDPINKDKWKNGTVSNGNMDLTAQEAKQLAQDLLMAAQEVEELEKICLDHDMRESNENTILP